MIPNGNEIISIANSAAEFGELLRQQRKLQALTQKELAGLTGVGVRFISELERGKESVELGKALLVAKMLGIKLFAETNTDE